MFVCLFVFFYCFAALVVLWWYRSDSVLKSHSRLVFFVFVFLSIKMWSNFNKHFVIYLKIFSKRRFQVCSNSKAEAFTQSFLKRSVAQQSKYDPDTVLSHKALLLEFPRQKKDASASKHKKAKGLNARQKREKKIYQIKPEQQRLVMISGFTVHHCWGEKCSCFNYSCFKTLLYFLPLRYESFLPLHELWKQYITDLCCGLKSSR